MKNSPLVLIAGGSGNIGTRLSEMLAAGGYAVRILTRKKNSKIKWNQVEWNPDSNYLENGALSGVDVIVNLSGTGIADKPWTIKRKKEILSSRVNPVKTLIHHLTKEPHSVKVFISASAVGIYPKNKALVMDESHGPGEDFLSQSVYQWESALLQAVLPENLRTVILRLGIVLSLKGGALPEVLKPFRFGMAAQLGNGKQTVSWVHVDDVCHAIIHAIKKQEVKGIYNVTAPQPVTFKDLIDAIIKVKGKRFIKVSVPAFVLKLRLGKRAGLVLDSLHVTSSRLEATGFTFQYQKINDALNHLLKEHYE